MIASGPAASPTASEPVPEHSRSRLWRPRERALGWIGIATVTLAAALLRLISLRAVPLDPFYDAAVRSMSLSWHNFFFGAFEPGGSVAIDKPPLDLWLQVASVKLVGFGPISLKLPQALAGTTAIPLLYLALRRAFGTGAALASALVLATLPISVLTARSDTMDAVMMALTVAALALVMHAAVSGRSVWCYLAAAMLGLAFNVKLLEALIAVPPLAVLAWLGLPGGRRRRALHIAGAGIALVAVSLSWLTATLAFPAQQRPFAIGSTNGSAWNAAFVFNGYDRIAGGARQVESSPAPATTDRGAPARATSDAALDRLPIRTPSATRLFDRSGTLSGRRLGFVLVVALLLGLPALLSAVRVVDRAGRERESNARQTGPDARDAEPDAGGSDRTPGASGSGARQADSDPREPHAGPHGADPGRTHTEVRIGRARRAAAIALALWLVGGLALFSVMARLHPRYVEAFDPAVAAAAGIGGVWACRVGRGPRAALAIVLSALVAYLWYLKGGSSSVGWLTVLAAAGAVAISQLRSRLRTGPVALLTAAAVLALPVTVAVAIVRDHAFDAGHAGFMRAGELARLSSYLLAHRRGARYEVAVSSATQAGSLVVHDAQPVLVLTTYDGLTLVSVARLRQLVATRAVRYALLGGRCHPGDPRTLALCSAPALWIRAHGSDVSRSAGLRRGALLWRLPTR